MEIKCTPQELKELLQKETPVAGTTDVNILPWVNELADKVITRINELNTINKENIILRT